MNMKKITMFLCGSLLLLSPLTYASPFGTRVFFPNGVYLAVGAVYSDITLKDLKFKITPVIPGYSSSTSLPIDKKSDDDFGFDVALGYAFENVPARIELAYTWLGDIQYRANTSFDIPPETFDVNFSGKVSPNTVMVNGILEFPFIKYVVPYLKAGLGVGINKASGDVDIVDVGTFSADHTEFGFVWQAGLGLRFRLTDNFSIDAEYRYVNLGKVKSESWTTDFGLPDTSYKMSLDGGKVSANQVLLNVVMYFGDQDPRSASGIPSLIDD